MKTIFTGTGVAMITPFKEDKSIDFNAFAKLIEFYIENKVEYLLVMGTTAESATLSISEKKDILSFAKKTIAGRVPIMYGLGGNNTAEIIEKLQSEDLDGVDGILSVAPYYNKPTQEGIYQHFAAIAIASKLPIILYNVPGRTSSNILPETVLRLASDFENIVAIKEASGDIEQVMNIIKNKPQDFTVISGDDGLTVPMIAIGAEGLISVAANIYPKQCSDMVRYAMEGNFTEAKKIHYTILESIDMMFAEGNPAGVKSFLQAKNMIEDHLRLPLVPISENLRNKISEEYKKVTAQQ